MEALQVPNNCPEDQDTKLLGAQVPISVYWAFKKEASERQESMQEAILHAAYMYMSATEGAKAE